MPNVLHMVDAKTPAAVLRQLALLRTPDERVISPGPPPEPCELDVRAVPRLALRLLLPSAPPPGLGSRKRRVHAWSLGAFPAARALSRRWAAGLVLHLDPLPGPEDLAGIVRGFRGELTGVTVASRAARQRLLDAGAPPEGVHVIGVATAFCEPDESRRRRLRDALALPEGTPLLLCTEQMRLDSGHRAAIWIHAVLREMHPTVALLLPGGGPARERVEFFAARAGRPGELHLTVDRFDAADCFAAADIVLHLPPRRMLLTGLAGDLGAPRPVIATALDGVGEVIDDGTDGRLVPPDDPRAAAAATLELMEDPATAQKLGDAAFARARASLDPTVVRRRLDAAYELVD